MSNMVLDTIIQLIWNKNSSQLAHKHRNDKKATSYALEIICCRKWCLLEI